MTKRQKSKGRANDLLCWLNQKWLPNQTHSTTYGRNSKASGTRILALVEAIRRADNLLASAAKQEPRRNFWTNPPKRVANAVSEIQRILDCYPIWPSVEIGVVDGTSGLHFDEIMNGGDWPSGEQIAIWEIVRLAQERKLSLLRKCGCELWFLAQRQDQQFCSAACRHRAYEQTEAYKAKRRDYMKQYYQLKNSGKVKA
jgi:hypothetical protein